MSKLSENSLFKSLFVALLILIMHVVLIAGVGILILLFYGVINHTIWMVAGVVLLTVWGYLFYRKVMEDSKKLKNVVGDLRGRNFEIKLLGGLATFRMGDSVLNNNRSRLPVRKPRELAAPESRSVGALTELSRLYEKKLISREEYEKAKKDLLW